MANIQVLILDPHTSTPLKGVIVEAHDISDGSFISTATTNDYGVASFSLTVDASFHARTVNTPPLYQTILPQATGPGPWGFDYIVDSGWAAKVSAGEGTEGQVINAFHGLTFKVFSELFGASNALEDAIATGGNRTIWIATTHTESIAATHSLGALSANQRIVVISGGRNRPPFVVAAGLSTDPLITHNTAASGADSLLRFEGMVFDRPGAASTGHFFGFGGGDALPHIELYDLTFIGTKWDGIIAAISGEGQVKNVIVDRIKVRDSGMQYVISTSSASTVDGMFVLRNSDFVELDMIMKKGTASSQDVGTDGIIIEGNLFRSLTNYGFQITHTRPLVFANNVVENFSAAADLFDLGTSGSTDIKDIAIVGNHIRVSNASGRAVHISPAAGEAYNISITGNTIRGPSASTAIQVDVVTNDCLISNAYRDWTTNVGGSGAAATPPNHEILDGSVHSDSVADGVTRGSLIYGNSTPKWDELVLGAAATYLNSDGSDAAWKAIQASEVGLPLIGSPTFTHVEHLNTVYHSSGWISGGAISDAGGATIDVAAGTGAIRATDSPTAQLLFFDFPASNGLAITANSIRYIGVEYNAGTPQVVVRTSDNFDDNTDFSLGTVVNEAGTLHIQNAPWKIGDHASAMIQRARGTMPIARDKAVGGLIFSETGTRNVAVTTGALWHGLTPFTIGAIDTDPGGAADTFDTYSAGGQEATGVAAWPNTQYDNAGTLTNMTTNRWANLWWYLELDGELVMVYGTNQYTSAALAGEEAAPSTLPNRLQVHGVLAARFIFQKSAGTAEEILSAFDTPFSVLGVTDHGNLAGLADDDHTQYALVDGTRGVSEHTYVFVPDAAKGADITVADQQGILHHSGDQEETVTAVYLDAETAPTGASLIIVVEFGDTDDLDTVGSWTTIDTVTLTATNKSVKDSSPTQATLPANRLIRMNVTQVGSTVTGKDAAVHVKVKRKLTT